MKVTSTSDAATKELGARVASVLEPGSVIALVGPLGAGKTCFVQGMARGIKVPGNVFVRSPSFTLVNQYQGEVPLYHIDFYRLDEAASLGDLGLDELFEGKGITVIEWADKFMDEMPKGTLAFHFEIIDDLVRTIEFPKEIADKLKKLGCHSERSEESRT
jgi:tRNA threonylcarbamoyladenosine biosynthesis protein TsaE